MLPPVTSARAAPRTSSALLAPETTLSQLPMASRANPRRAWPLRVARIVQPVFGSVFEAFQTFMTFFRGPLLALLLLGMLTRRATSQGALAGMILGVGTAAALNLALSVLGPEYGVSYLWVAWRSFAAALVGTVAVSVG